MNVAWNVNGRWRCILTLYLHGDFLVLSTGLATSPADAFRVARLVTGTSVRIYRRQVSP